MKSEDDYFRDAGKSMLFAYNDLLLMLEGDQVGDLRLQNGLAAAVAGISSPSYLRKCKSLTGGTSFAHLFTDSWHQTLSYILAHLTQTKISLRHRGEFNSMKPFKNWNFIPGTLYGMKRCLQLVGAGWPAH